jgi:hypothetical protein
MWKSTLSRRTVLRGALGALAVTVPLPFLDCFLDENGSALADGSPLPIRFGTWFWGLGMDAAAFIPKKTGADYDLPPQIASWKDIKQHVNVFSNYNVLTDGKPNLCHFTGWVALRSGIAPGARGELLLPSVDVLIADAISGASRFRTLDVAATGSAKDSYSFSNGDAINPPEVLVSGLYRKVFGDEFQDPNSANFTPAPSIMARRSVLSGVREESSSLQRQIGAADRIKLDQYFTSLREFEQRLDLQMQKPPPAPTCKVPGAVAMDLPPGTEVEAVAERHKLMSDIMAMALACNQTRVFNMTYSNSALGLSKRGLDKVHHTITHEEAVDEKLGYQPTSYWFLVRAMESFAYFIKALASVPEGAGTVLDNSIVYAHSDSSLAKLHSTNGIPMMTAGKGGGSLKTGLHINGNGEAPTQLGYTLMKAMGLGIGEWGKGSLKTSKTISEIVA